MEFALNRQATLADNSYRKVYLQVGVCLLYTCGNQPQVFCCATCVFCYGFAMFQSQIIEPNPKSKGAIDVMLFKLMWLFLAGGFGTLARYGLSGLVQRLFTAELPYGTFAVNAVGCLLFGFVWALADERLIVSGETRFLILTGFLGAFTTFSTFAFETGGMLRDFQGWYAAGNILAHNVIGIGAALLGMAIAKLC